MDEMQIVKLLKALSDRSRIAIVRNLLAGPMYVELLAERLGLTPPTVSFHLKKLEECGLVRSSREQYYMLYRIDAKPLESTLKALIVQSATREPQDLREQEYRRKVLGSFFSYGKLMALPVQRKKKRIVLEEIARLFEPGKQYAEKEVNLIIADVFDDFCTIRRDMISEGLMTRENGIYTRLPEQTPPYDDKEGTDGHEQRLL